MAMIVFATAFFQTSVEACVASTEIEEYQTYFLTPKTCK